MTESREDCKSKSDECIGRDCYYCEYNNIYNIYNTIDVTDNTLLYSSYGVKSAEIEKANRKKNRYMVRAFRGVACGLLKGCRFRWFVHTESDKALADKIDFGVEWHKFLTWLRYYCPDFQYDVVEHRQGEVSKVSGERRRNWHILSYGSDKLPVLEMREYWLGHYKSTVTGMEEVHNIAGAIKYMAGYLSDVEKFHRSWCSQGWVFPGWLGWSKWYKTVHGEYPTVDSLTEMSLMSEDERMWMMAGYKPKIAKKKEPWEPISHKFYDSKGNEYSYANGVYLLIKGKVAVK